MSRPYTIGFKAQALKDLQRLDRPIAERILGKLLWLARFADYVQHQALTGKWSEFYRYRVGDYRMIYRLVEEEYLMIVEHIGHRQDVYDE
jgi:mRNA interferase RelE/StbE